MVSTKSILLAVALIVVVSGDGKVFRYREKCDLNSEHNSQPDGERCDRYFDCSNGRNAYRKVRL